MVRAFKVELWKLFAQRGTYVGFPVFAALIALIVYGTWRHAPEVNKFPRLGGDGMIVAGTVVTAPFVLQFILPATMEILMPLLIAAVAGGLVAAEIQSGTMRTLLIRPISRLHLIAAKIGAACTYTLALSFFVVVLAVLLCYAVFQPGDLLSLSAGGLVIFSHQEAVARLALAYGLAVVGRLVIALVALMFSCLFDNGLTAAALTIAALIVFGALQQIPYFDKWEPYFLTWHLDIYRLPLQANPTWDDACRRILGLAAYSVAACGVAALAFVHRDIP